LSTDFVIPKSTGEPVYTGRSRVLELLFSSGSGLSALTVAVFAQFPSLLFDTVNCKVAELPGSNDPTDQARFLLEVPAQAKAPWEATWLDPGLTKLYRVLSASKTSTFSAKVGPKFCT